MITLTLAFIAALSAPITSAEPAPSGDSLYGLTGTWTDQGGKALQLASFAGRPVVVAMIYTSCRAACPLTVADMRAIEKKLDAATQSRVHFVLVSFDPARDAPAALQRLALEQGLDLGRWTLLTGTADDVRDLAAVLGMKIRPVHGEFVHSSIITILDARGVIAKQTLGVREDPTVVAAMIKELAR